MNSFDLHIEEASLAYQNKTIFSDINLVIPTGEWVSLLGPSGIGKSSLLRLIAGLMPAGALSQGKIYTKNQLSVNQQIAYMGQTDLLLPWLTVFNNAILSLKLRYHKPKEYGAKIKQAKLLLEKVGLSQAMAFFPSQLSGGMRQRVALVRTLLEDKPIVLMDEPFSALDAITRYKLQALAADLLKNKTVLFITHDPTEALRLAHHIYIMEGQPARLRSIVQLSSPTPRELNDHQLIKLQILLFQELSQVAEEKA